MDELFSDYKNCTLCPRNCRVDRTTRKGFCGESSELRIDSALLHLGEEPPISHKNGSGTIFFNGCSLRCVYCQNMQISQSSINDKKYTLEEFVALMESLIAKGAENINFVTPDHFAPHIIEGIKVLKERGHRLPFVYNCSGYETIGHLKMINDFIDIYLFDYKYSIKDIAKKYSNATDYPEIALSALEFIHKNKGELLLNKDGKAIKGLLIRHLVLPENILNSTKALDDIFFTIGNKCTISLMSQYDPRYLQKGFPEISNKLKRDEYDKVLEHLSALGFENSFVQELPQENDGYTPDFNEKNIFKQI